MTDTLPPPSSPSLNKPHPALLTTMVLSAKQLSLRHHDHAHSDIIYLTVKHYLRAPQMAIPQDQLADTIFAYYLDVYRGFVLTQTENEVIDKQDPRYLASYHDASLSLFDLYRHYPHECLARRLLVLNTQALHEVITLQQSSSDQPMKTLISRLSTIALLAQTVSCYVKGTKRQKSYDYIAWLKGFFEQALTGDLSFMEDNVTLKNIVQQITTKAAFVKIA